MCLYSNLMNFLPPGIAVCKFLCTCHPCQLSEEPPPLEDATGDAVTGSGEVQFPVEHLTHLDEQLGRPKWVVPVRPDDDLERLLKAAIKLCKQGGWCGWWEGGRGVDGWVFGCLCLCCCVFIVCVL